MAGNADVARLQKELDELREESRSNFKTVEVSIRKSRLALAVAEHNESIRRLRQPVSLLDWHPREGASNDPNVSGGLLDRLRQGTPVADSLGNVSGYVGLASVLDDPILENWPTSTTAIVVAPGETLVGPYWVARWNQISGAAPTAIGVYADDRLSHSDPITSARGSLAITFPAAASKVTVEIENEDFVSITSKLQYLVGAIRLLPDTSIASWLEKKIRVQILDSAGVVLKDSGDIDYALITTGDNYQLFAAEGPTDFTAGGGGILRTYRILLTVAKAATGGAQAITLRFGDPQLHVSGSPDPTSFAPNVGRWNPEHVLSYGAISTDTVLGANQAGDTMGAPTLFHRINIAANGRFLWGPGNASPDLRMTRAASGALAVDTNGSAVDTHVLTQSTAGRRSYYSAQVAGDTVDRMFLGGDATLAGLELGPGNASRDTRMYRGIAGQMIHDANGSATGTLVDASATGGQQAHFRAYVTGDSNARFLARGDAAMTGWQLSSGAATADIRVSRSGANLIHDSNGQAVATNYAIRATVGQVAQLQIDVTGDVGPRFVARGDSGLAAFMLGPGGTTQDIRFRRSSIGTAVIDDNDLGNNVAVEVRGKAAGGGVWGAFLTGDGFDRMNVGTVGLKLGSGAAAIDSRLYRTGAKALEIDDDAGGACSLTVRGTLNGIGGTFDNGTRVSVTGHGAADHADITRSVFLPVGVAMTNAGAVGPSGVIGAAPNQIPIIALADAATAGCVFDFWVPADWTGGSLKFAPLWIPGATDGVAHTVRWTFVTKLADAGSTVSAAGTTVTFTGTSAARTVNVIVQELGTDSTVTPTGVNQLVRFNLQRIGADAADTYVGVVNVIGVIVTYSASQ